MEKDDVLLYEVMVESLDADWWKGYRRELEAKFQQEELVVRAHLIDRL